MCIMFGSVSITVYHVESCNLYFVPKMKIQIFFKYFVHSCPKFVIQSLLYQKFIKNHDRNTFFNIISYIIVMSSYYSILSSKKPL